MEDHRRSFDSTRDRFDDNEDDDEDDDDDDGRMQYIRNDFLRANMIHDDNGNGDGEGDDDSSSRFFVSEPSTSDAESLEHRIRFGGAAGGIIEESLLFLDQPSLSEEEILPFIYPNNSNSNSNTLQEKSAGNEGDGDEEVGRSSFALELEQSSTPAASPRVSPTEGIPRSSEINPNTLESVGATIVNASASASAAPPIPPTTTTIGVTTIHSTNYNTNNDNTAYKTTREERPLLPSAAYRYSPDNLSLSSYEASSPNRWDQKVELDLSLIEGRSNNNNNNNNKNKSIPTTNEIPQGETVHKNENGNDPKMMIPSQRFNHQGRKTHLHGRRRGDSFLGTTTSGNQRGAAHPRRGTAGDGDGDDHSHSSNSNSNSSSSASEAHVQQLGEFLDDLRISSEGQMKESSVPGSNTSFESSILVNRETEVEDVLRRKIDAVSGPGGNRYDPRQQQPQSQSQSHVLSTRDSSASRPLFMEYSNDSLLNVNSRGATDSLVMTFSTEPEDYHHQYQYQYQYQQSPAGDRIDTTKSPRLSPAPTLSLPPLHSTTPTSVSTTGRKQPHNRARLRSGDGSETKSFQQQDAKVSSGVVEGTDTTTWTGVHTNTHASANTNTNTNYTKSTIDQSSSDERAKQQKEIGLFSQFAIGSKDNNDGATRQTRRKKQVSYRQMRTRHIRQQESGEDSSSQASSDQSYVNFFQSPSATSLSQQSLSQPQPQPQSLPQLQLQSLSQPQPPTDVRFEPKPSPTTQSPATTPSRGPVQGQEQQESPGLSTGPHHQYPSGMLWLRDRSLKKTTSLNLNNPRKVNPVSVSDAGHHASYDDYLMTGAHHHQFYHPPPTLPSMPLHGMPPTPWGSAMYHPSPTYYVPGHSHQRGYNEVPLFLDPRVHLDPNHLHPQYPHDRSHSPAFPNYERPPPDNSIDGHFNEPQQQQVFYSSSTTPHPESPNMAGQKFFVENANPQNRNHSQSYDSLLHKTSSGEQSSEDATEDMEEQDRERRDSYVSGDDSSSSVSDHPSDDSIENERNIHHLHDGTGHDTRVIRHHNLDSDRRSQFLPRTYTMYDNAAESKYPTFVCPNCKTRQRQFFTVSSAPKRNESAGMFIALGFATYVIASLYIFGLQEGWGKLDCIYFAVITLTTAGLGDLVPTSNGAKIICSIYIYFGVAFIGLLLGSYIASMLDERSYMEAVANQIRACPNCTRIRNIRYASERRRAGVGFGHLANNQVSMERVAQMHASKLNGASQRNQQSPEKQQMFQSERIPSSQSMEREMVGLSTTPKSSSGFDSLSPSYHRQLLGSPMTSQILQRQSHTRHVSMDLRKNEMFGSASDLKYNPTRHRHGSADAFAPQRTGLNVSSGRFRHNSADIQIPATVTEGTQSNCDAKNGTTPIPPPPPPLQIDDSDEENDASSSDDLPPPPVSEIPFQEQADIEGDDLTADDNDSCASDSVDSEFDASKGRSKAATSEDAKYVIRTLREALVNSMVIIAFGCLGFYLIEGLSMVDSWYFTTVLLTSTGYGDIVPKSDGGKLFATVYLLVAGTILLNNMSMISMIPLELRKRRTEKAVLSQFGDTLDDDALRELATGPLVQRINLERHDPRGLDECTREMFALAMMIRLGKVTENDIKQTFAAFRKLDVNNDGVLNSRSIIGGMVNKQKRMSRHNNNGNNVRSDSQAGYTNVSQGYGSWVHPAVPSYHDGSNTNSGSTYGTNNAPHSQVHAMPYSDHTPLLSLSERALPQYGNRYRSATSYSMNE